MRGSGELHSFLQELGLTRCRWTSCQQHGPKAQRVSSELRRWCRDGIGSVPWGNSWVDKRFPRRSTCPTCLSGYSQPPPHFTQRNRPRFMGPDSICFFVCRLFPDKLRSDEARPDHTIPKRNKLPSLSAGRPLGAHLKNAPSSQARWVSRAPLPWVTAGCLFVPPATQRFLLSGFSHREFARPHLAKLNQKRQTHTKRIRVPSPPDSQTAVPSGSCTLVVGSSRGVVGTDGGCTAWT